jgi:hypothetical protein
MFGLYLVSLNNIYMDLTFSNGKITTTTNNSGGSMQSITSPLVVSYLISKKKAKSKWALTRKRNEKLQERSLRNTFNYCIIHNLRKINEKK